MNFFCPKCKTQLSDRGVCSSCDTSYDIKNNVQDLIGDSGNYWGEIPQEEINKLNFLAEKIGYKEAVFEFFKNHKKKEMYTYILNCSLRAGWLSLVYSNKMNSNCLDIGAGFGAISEELTHYYNHVYSLESVKERVEFLNIRRKQSGRTNWSIIRENFMSLPFPDNYFDLVTSNGVLEWVGLADYSKNVTHLQKQFLSEINRVLKPGGCVYIGIENRFGFRYFRGALDHSGLPYTSVVPRRIADYIVERNGKNTKRFYIDSTNYNSYRTYTYSRNGYKSLLNSAGFNKSNIDLYYTDGSYNFNKIAVKSNWPALMHYAYALYPARQLLKYSRLPTILSNLLLFCNDAFLIFAYKEYRTQTDIEIYIKKVNIKNNKFIKYSGSKKQLIYFPYSNNLMNISYQKQKRIFSFKTINVSKQSIGTFLNIEDNNQVEKTINKMVEFHKEKTVSKIAFTSLLNKYKKLAIRYGFDKYVPLLNRLEKYKNKPVFTKFHGDLWLGNIVTGSRNTIKFVDYGKNSKGIYLIDLSLFILSLINDKTTLFDTLQNPDKKLSYIINQISKIYNIKAHDIYLFIPIAILANVESYSITSYPHHRVYEYMDVLHKILPELLKMTKK